MKHNSLFLEYLTKIKEEFEYNEDFKNSARFANIIKNIIATSGNPFAFFIWYYNGGFTYYEKYFKNFGFVGDNPFVEYHFNEKNFTLIGKKLDDKYSEPITWSNWDDIEVTLNVDIVSLFASEFHKVNIIFFDLWKKEINKKEFVKIISGYIKYLTHKLQLAKLDSSDCSPEIKLASKKLYYQIFTKFIILYQKELLDFGIKMPKFKYPEVDINAPKPKKIVTNKSKNIELKQMGPNQVEKLYQLLIVNNNKNPSFITQNDKYPSHMLYDLLRNQGAITKKYPDAKYYLNCENIYAAYIFYWLVQKKYMAGYKTIENENIFYTRKGTKMTQEIISPTIKRLEKEHGVDYIKITSKKVKKPKQLCPLSSQAKREQIVQYLHESLSYIVSTDAAKS